MHILFIRHGEPNYDKVNDLSLVSYLGELTEDGILQAKKVASDRRVAEAQLIVCSPFTRALQTAAIISRETLIPIAVEPGLHEWLADKSHQFTLNARYGSESYHEFLEHNGVRDENCIYNWESAEEIASRAYPVMEKYMNLGYKKIVVVAHAMLIRTFGYQEQQFPYCGIYPLIFNENTTYSGFVPWNG